MMGRCYIIFTIMRIVAADIGFNDKRKSPKNNVKRHF